MLLRSIFASLLCAGLCWADSSATQPTTAPTTSPAAHADAPATTQPTAAAAFPTPAELIAKIKQMKDAEAQLPKVAYFDLGSKPLVEKPADFTLFGDSDVET